MILNQGSKCVSNLARSKRGKKLDYLAAILLAMLVVFAPTAGAQQKNTSTNAGSNSGAASAQTSSSTASDSDAYGEYDTTTSATGAQPVYPGEPMNKPPVETTIGPAKLRFYGTVLLNVSLSDTDEVGQDLPLWPLPGTLNVTFPDGTQKPAKDIHDTIFTARQSVFGITLNPATPSKSGWNPSALVEMDFFGPRPTDVDVPEDRVLNTPRLRKAYFQVEHGDFKFVAGQDSIIISPMGPISLSHVAYPLGFSAGDLFGWLPQVRFDYNHTWSGKTSTLFQVGVLRPAFDDPRLLDQPPASAALDSSSGLGERTSQPFYQARFAVSHPFHGSPATLGVAGHFGKEQVGAERQVDSWAFTSDYRVAVLRKLILRGEMYVGSNLVPFGGGIIQGIAALGTSATATPPGAGLTSIHGIGDAGGWAELTILATKKDVFYGGYSQDQPRRTDLLSGTSRDRNAVAWASYFRKITPGTTFALEYSNWDFRTTAFAANGTPAGRGGFGRGNVLNLAFAYAF